MAGILDKIRRLSEWHNLQQDDHLINMMHSFDKDPLFPDADTPEKIRANKAAHDSFASQLGLDHYAAAFHAQPADYRDLIRDFDPLLSRDQADAIHRWGGVDFERHLPSLIDPISDLAERYGIEIADDRTLWRGARHKELAKEASRRPLSFTTEKDIADHQFNNYDGSQLFEVVGSSSPHRRKWLPIPASGLKGDKEAELVSPRGAEFLLKDIIPDPDDPSEMLEQFIRRRARGGSV
jgi:hypothetical protein